MYSLINIKKISQSWNLRPHSAFIYLTVISVGTLKTTVQLCKILIINISILITVI